MKQLLKHKPQVSIRFIFMALPSMEQVMDRRTPKDKLEEIGDVCRKKSEKIEAQENQEDVRRNLNWNSDRIITLTQFNQVADHKRIGGRDAFFLHNMEHFHVLILDPSGEHPLVEVSGELDPQDEGAPSKAWDKYRNMSLEEFQAIEAQEIRDREQVSIQQELSGLSDSIA